MEIIIGFHLQEEIEIDFPEDREYDTLAGFILDKLGDIPKVGEEVKHENFSFKVIEIKNNRIDKDNFSIGVNIYMLIYKFSVSFGIISNKSPITA